MTKAIFHFCLEGRDAKTSTIKVKTIQLETEETLYKFPEELQLKEHHQELFATNIVKNAAKSLKSRGQFRRIKISLKGGLEGKYLDDEGNVCYGELYLDEVQTDNYPNPPSTSAPLQQKSIHSKAKDMVLTKFTGKNQDAKTFVKLFKQESERVQIEEEKFPETFKLFVEGPALDWYLAVLKTEGLIYPWELWETSFLKTFSERSWSEINYAYTFKHMNGPLLDYALKKRNLLLDADTDLTESSQINFIVLGLPAQVRSRITKKEIDSIDKLMSTIRQLEHLNIGKEKNQSAINMKNKNVNDGLVKKPCPHCIERGFPNRYHPEQNCRLKNSEVKGKYKNEQIKIINNSEIQDSVSLSEDAKND
ncbi:PREDICTED: uncharacterized protein LOC105450919 [Wasmannia auropunctata]|uniref:uncharacterized protein LOC105450919 n=1 Tax=Wasmannia auropunctata TaxID=64793 RepID=UPI0005F0BF80|nr:PREDICTED: uncharacterized protein LOC105450919 [Wasmannia auropunctata]